MMLKFTATCRSLRLLAETYIYSVLAVDGYTCRLGYRSLLGVDRMERMEGWRIPKLERVRYVPLYFNYPSTNNLPVEVTSKMHNCRPTEWSYMVMMENHVGEWWNSSRMPCPYRISDCVSHRHISSSILPPETPIPAVARVESRASYICRGVTMTIIGMRMPFGSSFNLGKL
jgi:hypothetical protein